MPQENVEIIRRFYEAFNRRDVAGALESADPDFEWIPARSLDQKLRGRENVHGYFDDLIEFLDPRAEPEEFFDKGDQVVGRVRAAIAQWDQVVRL